MKDKLKMKSELQIVDEIIFDDLKVPRNCGAEFWAKIICRKNDVDILPEDYRINYEDLKDIVEYLNNLGFIGNEDTKKYWKLVSEKL